MVAHLRTAHFRRATARTCGMLFAMQYLEAAELEAGFVDVRRSPKDEGRLELIVIRPAENERRALDEAMLDPAVGVVGDTWGTRGSRRTPDGSSHPDMQITLMNARAAALIAGGRERRALAGDQLYVDLDISYQNLPPGARLTIGDAVIEITDQPHLGCKKFSARFGADALRFVNSDEGRALNLRGIYARVVVTGAIRVGDVIRKA